MSANENNFRDQPFSLTSWNYGTYFQTNPMRNTNTNAKPPISEINKKIERANSALVSDKIVNDEYMKYLKEFKDIQRPSFRDTSKTRSSTKCVKYQLSFDEWYTLKAKQEEIFKKVKMIKENEDQKFEYFNKKIDENYDLVKNEKFNNWLTKKQSEKAKQEKEKQIKVDKKLMEKELKENDKRNKMNDWIKGQAMNMERNHRVQKMKMEKEKEENAKKQKEEEIKKTKAEEAFKLWIKSKEMQKRISNIENSTDSKSNNDKKMKRTMSQGTMKVVIGPYSLAKDLRNMQKKLIEYNNDYNAHNNYDYNEYEENDPNSGNMHQNYPQTQSAEDDQQTYENKNIDDSLQELSSIKKETPQEVDDD